MIRLTVAICTHNPRKDALAEVLNSLRVQTVPAERWELLIVDNASPEPVAGMVDLSWHPNWRVVREEILGIAHARLRALREITGDNLILFVDDDNVLSADYIEIGLRIQNEHPGMGCWGGQLLPRYEVAPPDWIVPFEKYLAVFPLKEDIIARQINGNYDSVPPTAGLFLRAQVASRYVNLIDENRNRLSLGARGDDPVRGEDTDLALCACDIGMSLGRFVDLRLTHIIPAERLTEDYMARLLCGIRMGTLMIEHFRNGKTVRRAAIKQSIWQLWNVLRLPDPHRKFLNAEIEGERKARKILRSLV